MISRAYEKLSFALSYFAISVKGAVCADFGSSTGGFVQVLIENGASKVYAIDTAYGELAWELRKNQKVVVLERVNALHVILPELVTFSSVDLSFTKLALALPNVLKNTAPGGNIIGLLKPQYEATRNELIKGVVKPEYVTNILSRTLDRLKKLPELKIQGTVASPITGKRGGNTEFLVFMTRC